MTDDILTLLRKYQPYSKLHGQAADEIERLRAENERLRTEVARLGSFIHPIGTITCGIVGDEAEHGPR
jgi:hypothetical protein